jgi:homoserine O-acetyltransferase
MSEYIEHDQQGLSVGIVARKNFTFAAPPSEMVLENGTRFGPITLAYETYGTPAADRRNAILVLHALSGDAHAAGIHSREDPKPGWWDIMIGPGKGIDTDKFFVVSTNILGSCMGSTGPRSINPATGKAYGHNFPLVTIGDMVRAQKALMDHLGIEKILAVIGGSIGGMQVLEWCVRYPEMVFAAVPLATTTRHSALAIAFNEVARQAIMADPNWNHGDYYQGPRPDMGLAVARMIGHITYLSDEAMRHKFGRRLQDKVIFAIRAPNSLSASTPTVFSTSQRPPTISIWNDSTVPVRWWALLRRARLDFWSFHSPPTGCTRPTSRGPL